MTDVYLDHAATTPLRAQVRDEMEPFLGRCFANPSSRHPAGVQAAEALDRARARLARALGARPEGVVFTSGGTEANNLALFGLARVNRTRRGHVLVGPTEHPSVREPARELAAEGYEVESLRLASDGGLDLEDAAERLRPDTVLVAQMLVQNEIGALYPVARLARLVRVRSPRARLHVDAVQAVGKLDASLDQLGADTLAISAHKVGGPKGSGALIVRDGVAVRPLLFGGGQERGLRSGTQDVPGAVGLGAAVELAESERERTLAHLEQLQAQFLRGLTDLHGPRPLARGTAGASAPWILAVLFQGAPAEVRMHHLEDHGVLVSAGSACQAAKGVLSPTYLALGLSTEESRRVLRFSFGASTTAHEIERALEALAAVEADLDDTRRERTAS